MSWTFTLAVAFVSALALASFGILRAGLASGSLFLLAAGTATGALAVAGIALLGRAVVLSERSEKS